MKKLLPMLLALCLTLTLTAHALEESDIFYVNDPSSILSDSLKSHVVDENYRLYDLDEGAEVVLVAVDFLGGKTPESFAYDVFNDWALGDADENNGVLILLRLSNRHRVTVVAIIAREIVQQVVWRKNAKLCINRLPLRPDTFEIADG